MTRLTKGIEQGLEMVDVATLTFHPRNVRQGDIGGVIASIRENGFFAPCAVQIRRATSASGTTDCGPPSNLA